MPRHIAAYLARKLTQNSLPDIGRVMDRDHTTILYAVEKVERLVSENPALALEIAAIAAEILK